MNSYQRMDVYILQRAKAEPLDGFRFHIPTLATEFGIDQAHVRGRLVGLHKDGYIVLWARDAYNCPKPVHEWRDEESFFNIANDKYARLTHKGDELLEELAAEAGERSQPKRAIGFHV